MSLNQCIFFIIVSILLDNFHFGCEKEGCVPGLCKPPPDCPDFRSIGEIIFDKMKNAGEKIAQVSNCYFNISFNCIMDLKLHEFF